MFDWDRFELENLNKKNDLIIFEFIELLYPHFSKAYFKDNRIKKKIKSVSKINFFKKKIVSLIKKKSISNILIMNFMKNDSLNSIEINKFIQSQKLNSLSFYNPGISTFDLRISNFNSSFTEKLRHILNRKNETIQKIKGKFYNFLVDFYDLKSNYLLVSGNKVKKKIYNYCKKRNIKIINGSSWDYSKILNKNKSTILNQNNYALYLDAPGPKFLSDSHIYKEKLNETVKHTYPSLNNFFSFIEKKLNLKIIVAPHPKTKIKNRSSLFNYRTVISGRTLELIKKSKFIITRNSTAVTFAAYFNKPIILFYTNETYNTEAYQTSLYLSKSLGVKLININDYKNINFKKLLKFKRNIFEKYLNNYCKSKKVRWPNYKLIQSLIKE